MKQTPKSLNQEKSKGWNRGSVLTATLLTSAILTIIAGGLSQLSLRDALAVYRDELSTKAFFLAEAGVSDAYALLKDNYNNKDNPLLFPQTALGEGTYDVTILQPSGRVVIQSLGSVKNIERTVLVEVKLADSLEGFNYGLFSNNEGELVGSAVINANIVSNDSWDIRGNSDVNGVARAVDEIEVTGNASVDEELENADTVDFPTFDFNYYYNLAASADRYEGDQNWNNVNLQPTNGVVYVNGDVDIQGTSTLVGAIVATGKIDVNGTFTQTGVSNLPSLMSRDESIELRGDVVIGNGLVYSGGDDVEIHGNVTVTGSIMSFDQVIVTGNLTLTASISVPEGLNDTGAGTGIRKLTYHE